MVSELSFVVLGGLPVLIWLGILLHPARSAGCRPVAEDEPAPPEPEPWPAVAILVPARNEAQSLPATLPALLDQDYPGELSVVLVDDRSEDGTADVARELAARSGRPERLHVVAGTALPAGWIGKVWALEQGRRALGEDSAEWLVQTDADIRHAPDSVRGLVAEALERELDLNSRMARLHCASGWEKLLVPAFVWFFNLLYPMRRVNDERSPVAASAGGCILLKRERLEALGGYGFMRSAVIDDCTLARAVKRAGGRLHLAWSRTRVVSVRPYEGLHDLRRMIRRTAFTELRHSALRLVLCLLGLALTFLLPFVAIAVGLASERPLVTAGGAVAWLLMTQAYSAAPRFYRLAPAWWLSLPLAAVLYGAFTFESAWLHWRGRREAWRAAGAATTEPSEEADRA